MVVSYSCSNSYSINILLTWYVEYHALPYTLSPVPRWFGGRSGAGAVGVVSIATGRDNSMCYHIPVCQARVKDIVQAADRSCFHRDDFSH